MESTVITEKLLELARTPTYVPPFRKRSKYFGVTETNVLVIPTAVLPFRQIIRRFSIACMTVKEREWIVVWEMFILFVTVTTPYTLFAKLNDYEGVHHSYTCNLFDLDRDLDHLDSMSLGTDSSPYHRCQRTLSANNVTGLSVAYQTRNYLKRELHIPHCMLHLVVT